MTLEETIAKDTVNAIKDGKKFELSVLRMLKSALQLEKINKKHDLVDDEVVSVIKKQVKVRKDSIEEYTKYERMDLVENLVKEVEVLSVYLPEELSLDVVKAGVKEIIDELGEVSTKDMGKIMKLAGEKFGSQADMKVVSSLVREFLS